MPRIYLVRHGQTLFNVMLRTQGQCDSPLTEKGISMAQNLGNYFRENNYVFDHGFCSTLERCEDTLNYITKGELSYTRLKSLKEMNFGTHEGGSDVELWGNNLNAGPEECDEILKPFNAEKLDSVIERMRDSMKVIGATDYENILVVSHGLIIVAWLQTLGEDFINKVMQLKKGDDIFMNNCDCCVFDINQDKIEFVDYINYDDVVKGE